MTNSPQPLPNTDIPHFVLSRFNRLYEYVRKERYRGYDPFDGLNSKQFQSFTRLFRMRILRIAWIQFFKRSPINFRSWVGIQKEYNPKGLSLFIRGLLYRYQSMDDQVYLDEAEQCMQQVLNLRSDHRKYNHWAWGYNFHWQARAFFSPKYAPNIITSSFVVTALHHFGKVTSRDYSNIILSVADGYIRDHVIIVSKDKVCLSYIPHDGTRIHNANLWGAVVLALAYRYSKREIYKALAMRCLNYSCHQQGEDGSWVYGENSHHRFIDNFHTGYNIEAIDLCSKYLNEDRFNETISKGLAFYQNRFFLGNGIPKYYHDATYPIDIHCCSQAIVTLLRVEDNSECRSLADRVVVWALSNMQASNGGFYYQKHKWYTNRIEYIRWGQAWMFYALGYYLWKVMKRNDGTGTEKNTII